MPKRNNNKHKKRKTKNKRFLKSCIEQFFNFSYKNVIHENIILFDAALLVQKNTMQEGYAERNIK